MIPKISSQILRFPSLKARFFYPEETLMLGVEEKTVNGTTTKLYSKERLLVELIRHKNKLPFDYYKEIISSYRNKIYDLDEEWF